MQEMDKVTQSNAASAEESASAAGQLSLQAGNLLNVVSEMQALAHGAERGQGQASGGRVARPAMPGPAAPQHRAIAQAHQAGGHQAKAADSDRVMPMDDNFEF
jgi:methyl-accepting chemotaxis protein